MRALQGGNLGRNQSCRHVMCAAAKPAAHDRRTFSPHFPIHECTLTFSPKHVVSNCYVIVQFISVVCSGPINTSTTTSTASSPPTTSSTAPYTSAGYHHHCDHYNNNNNKRMFGYQKGGLSRMRRTREWHHQRVGGWGVVNKQECTRNDNEGGPPCSHLSFKPMRQRVGTLPRLYMPSPASSFSARSLPYPTDRNAPVRRGVDPTRPIFACHSRGLTASFAMAYHTLSLVYTCLV